MKRKVFRFLLNLLTDVLAAAVLLCVFAFVHHVLPWLRSRAETELPRAAVETPAPAAASPSSLPEEIPEAEQTITAPLREKPEQVLTAWQERFAERFSEEIVRTDSSYTSPNLSITIETKTFGEGNRQTVYYVADVYVASVECLCTYLAKDTFSLSATQDVLEMDAASGAEIAISGDFYSYNAALMVRNGEIYRAGDNGCDVCVLWKDGRMDTFEAGEYDTETLLREDVWQIWNFGPELLEEDGSAKERFRSSEVVQYPNPRSSLGFYEPGHYCFVVADGRIDGWSAGLTMRELAQVYEELGCACAYNLDGGGSAVMTFGGERFSRQSNGADRKLADIVLVREPETADRPRETIRGESE